MKKRVAWVFAAVIPVAVVAIELQTSYLQSRVFSDLSAELNYHVELGESEAIVFPEHGPYNDRLGFSQLPNFAASLQTRGYHVVRQARFSQPLLDYVEWGGYPFFREAAQSGLSILDGSGVPMYRSRYPKHVYRDFSDIPTVVINTLLYIENRELLEERFTRRNPAVEWDRLATALSSRAVSSLVPGETSPGASTLATQIEKYRYSPGGLTSGMNEKLRQMIAASLRAYRDGPHTRAARERIVRDYLNSTPLAGRPGFGEIQGLGDGLWAWYGLDFDSVNNLLRNEDGTTQKTEWGRAFRAVLSLMLAQRRPSYYLAQDRDALARLTESYLHLLADEKVIGIPLRDAALAHSPEFRNEAFSRSQESYIKRKAVNNLRTELLTILDVDNLYSLDRLDLTVRTSVSEQVQQRVTSILRQASNVEGAHSLGLIDRNLLGEEGLDKVRYSVLLYESTPLGNMLRVQADNLDRPLDLNDGSMLDLGSTAKLRTLISYLEIVESLYLRYRYLPVETLEDESGTAGDPISTWTLEFLRDNPEATLRETLDAAMQRPYSASPNERFFTAGGLHRFGNFDADDNHRVLSVADAFNSSVNLVFVRLMRDLVRYHSAKLEPPGLFDEADGVQRIAYLRQFADREGRLYLSRFYQVYGGLDSIQRLITLGRRMPPVPRRLAMAFRAVRPAADEAELQQFLKTRLTDDAPSAGQSAILYKEYDPARFDGNDRAYLAGVHPLELWLLNYLDQNPGATPNEVVDASTAERQAAYDWLFRTNSRTAQDRRIRIELEREAFEAIHRQWRRLGYPFTKLVPSYATALGVSADRPNALAELMGIIVNDGVRLPLRQIERLHFAEGTAYETVFAAAAPKGERILSREVNATVYGALVGVVETGTGRRLQGVFRGAGGEPVVAGGKTGTGDHKSKQFAANGRLIDVQVENRNAIFTFFIDERFFGTVMAHVAGPDAADFDYTSALAAQLLKSLEPALQPLIRKLPEHLALQNVANPSE